MNTLISFGVTPKPLSTPLITLSHFTGGPDNLEFHFEGEKHVVNEGEGVSNGSIVIEDTTT